MNLIWQSICMITFGALCWAVGNILLKGFLGKNFIFPELARHSLAFATGNVAISYLLTVLGFIGGFASPVLWIIFLGGIGVTILYIAGEIKKSTHLKSLNQPVREQIEKRKEGSGPFIFLMGVVGVFFLPAIFQAAAPPYVRDSLVYHLLCPKEYLKAGHLVHIEGNIFSAFPKGHEVLMTILLAIGGDRAAQGFSIFQQVAAISSLYSLIRLMAGSLTASFCAIGYATVPPVIYFSGCGYVEPALLMTFGGSLLVLFLFLRFREQMSIGGRMDLRTVTLIGFLAGWMPALKYNGLIYLGLIGLILLWSYKRAPAKEALTMIGAFSFSAGPGLCWMVWNWITLGNPVYPMAWGLFGGKSWDEGRALAMSLYLDTYGMGRNLSDYLLLIWRLAFSGRFDSIWFDGAMGPVLLLSLALAMVTAYLLIRRRIKVDMTKQIGFMFIVSGAFFVFGTQQTRFWLPSQMLACVFAVPAIGLLINLAKKKHIIKIILFLILVGSLAWNIGFLGKQFFKVGYYRPVLGLEPEKDFLARNVPGYPAIEFINQNLPKSSRLMCVWTGAYGYYIDRKYYSDTFVEDVTLKQFIHTSTNGRDLSQKLIQAGFTHLFLNLSILGKNMGQSERIILGDFLTKETQKLFNYQNYEVFEIHRQ
jgi:hypothetical protein